MIKKRIPSEFPSRKEILALIKAIEDKRNVFCYGKRKPNNEIEKFIDNFQQLRKIINKNLKDFKNDKKK